MLGIPRTVRRHSVQYQAQKLIYSRSVIAHFSRQSSRTKYVLICSVLLKQIHSCYSMYDQGSSHQDGLRPCKVVQLKIKLYLIKIYKVGQQTQIYVQITKHCNQRRYVFPCVSGVWCSLRWYGVVLTPPGRNFYIDQCPGHTHVLADGAAASSDEGDILFRL